MKTLSEQSELAPPVGRALRVLLGLALMVYMTPIYFRLPSRVLMGSLLLMLALTVAYCVIHIAVSRHVVGLGPTIGTVLVHALLVALYVVGFLRTPIVGGGKGQVAAVTFLGVSLVVAGIRGIAGCELMAIPGLFFQKDVKLACLIFSPLDKLEQRLRVKRDSTRGSANKK